MLLARDERRIERSIQRLRREEGNFTARRILLELNMKVTTISVRTMQRHLKRMGYRYVQARKKGILTTKDCKGRLAFARKMKKNYRKQFWTEDVCFYLDGVSFYHKYNPLDQARVASPIERVLFYAKDTTNLMDTCSNNLYIIISITHFS